MRYSNRDGADRYNATAVLPLGGTTPQLKGTMNIPQRTDEESLAMWCNRLANIYHFSEIQKEVLLTVNTTSYSQGVTDIINELKREGRL